MIAADLLQIALEPDTGAMHNRTALAVGARGALFAELAIAGCLVAGHRAPRATPFAPPPEDHILSTLHRAVADRPGVYWQRWFTHVSADREAVARHLVDNGVWVRTGQSLLRGPGFRPVEESARLALLARTVEVIDRRRAPDTAEEAVLAGLVTICGLLAGRPRPRAADTEAYPLLDILGPPEFGTRAAVEASVRATARALRRRRSR